MEERQSDEVEPWGIRDSARMTWYAALINRRELDPAEIGDEARGPDHDPHIEGLARHGRESIVHLGDSADAVDAVRGEVPGPNPDQRICRGRPRLEATAKPRP